jgi:HTH-type transcriptional regulator/antitoxin HigA
MKNKMGIIKSKEQYNKSLKRFEEIFLAKEGTVESKEADVLSILIKEYEDKHFVINTIKEG